MAILNHGSTIRTADGGQSTTTIVTASNIGTYGVAANSTYFIGTTQNIFNRASGAQTLTGVSIDGNAANITAYTINQNVGTANAPTFAGAALTSTLSITGGDGLRVFKNGASTVTSQIYWANSANTIAYNWQIDENGNSAMWGYGGVGWANALTVTAAGSFRANGDVRAPVFYDSNDTTYYIDPANGGFNLRGGNSNRVTFNSGDSGIIVTNAEGVSSNVRLGCAWGRPGIYNGSSITIGAETTIDFVIANFVKGYIDSSSNLFSNGSVRSPIFYDSNNTAYYLDAANSGTSLLVAGNVGIGNTSPSAKLHVLGASYTTASAANNNVRFEGGGGNGLGFGTIDATSTYASWIQSGYVPNFATATYALLLNPLGGNVGIGTTSPTHKLHVYARGNGAGVLIESDPTDNANQAPALKLYPKSTDASERNWSISPFRNYAQSLSISSSDSKGGDPYSNATTRLIIDGINGNVGIGTISPSQKLHVVGTGFASTDFRAPIFYDSDNTTYYLDPNASTSGNLLGVLKQNDGKFVRDSYFRTISGVGDYYASGASGWYTVASITLTTNCTGGVLYGTLYDNRYDGADAYQIAIVARAECDFTTNNESHYVNVGCTILGSTNIINYQSKIRVLLVASSTNSRTYEVQFLETAWNRDTWQLETGGSPVWTIYSTAQAPGTSTGTARVFYISNKNADNIRANTASYSPIYYDSSDTSYYSDPAGLNRFNALNIGNQGALTGNTTYALGAYHNSRYMVGLRYSSGGAAYPWLVHDSWNGSAFIIHFNGVGDRFHVSESGIAYVTGDFRAPIFYDSNNTSYYLDPASTSNLVGLTVANTITGSISGNAATATTSLRSTIEDTRAAQRTPNDYDDYRASYEFTNAITGLGDWHSAFTLQGWHNGYAAWQIIGPASTSAHENFYLRSGVNTTWNSVRTILHSGNYNSYSPTLTGTGASGSWGINITGSSASSTGNAATATTLQTARNINGTSFNGSAAITTATWGTARTLTIGSTGKSVDGSAGVSWSLAEIGAAATNQTMFIGTTSVAINRASASQTLTGVSIDGNAATASNATQFGGEANTNFMRGLAGGTEANINNYTDNGFRTVAYTGHGKGLLSFNVGSSIGTVQHEYFYNIPTNGWRVRNKTDNTTWSSWGNIVMTDTNQGALTGTVITTGNSSGLSPTFTNLYANVFYDQNNTAYYVDAASTSILNTIRLAGKLTNNGSVADDDGFGIYWENSEGTSYAIYREAGSWTNPFPDLRIAFHTGIKLGANAGYNGIRFYNDYDMATQVMSVNNSGDGLGANNVYINNSLQAGSSLRSPIFYDSDNTAYYINAASVSNLNAVTLADNIDVGTYIYLRNNLRMLNSASNGWIETIVRNSGSPYFTNPIDGGTFLASDTSENNNWLFQENVRGWGLFYFNRGTQSGQTFGSYTTIGAETFIIGQGSGTTMPSTWTGYNASSKVAIMLSNYTGYIWANDTIFSATGLRAPIFYDSNDTTYYVDAASASVLNYVRGTNFYDGTGTYNVNLGSGNSEGRGLVAGYSGGSYGGIGYNVRHTTTGGTWIAPGTDTSTYLLFSNGIYFYYAAGGTAGRTLSYSTIGSLTSAGIFTVSGDSRAPIFYDSNNTAYYIDPASGSNVNNLTTAGTLYTNNIAKNATGSPIIINSGLATSLALRVYYDMNLYNTLTFTDSSWNSQGAIYGSSSVVNIVAATATTTFTKYAGYSQEGGSFRAPLFYDSNDTTYYTDPAGFSLISSMGIGGLTSSNNVQMYDSYVDGSSSYLQSPPLIIRKDSSATGAIDQAPVGLFIYNLNGTNNTWTKLSMGSREAVGAGNTVSIAGLAAQKTAGTANSWATGDLHFWTKSGATQITNMVAYSSGYVQSGYSFRAPIFYDSNNTGYYLDPASSSQLSAVYANDWFRAQGNTGLYFQDKGYGITSAGAASNSYGNASTYGTGLNGWQGWGIGSRHCIMSTGGDNFGVHDNTRSWLYYWDGTYHRFQYGYLESANSLRAPLFYDSDNTAYYANPAGTSVFNELVFGSNITIRKNNDRNLEVQGGGGSDSGIVGKGSSGQFAFQVYGSGSGSYGFLDGVWAGWDIRKVVDGDLFLNDNNSYYLNPASTSLFNATRHNSVVAGSTSGMTSAGQIAVYSASSPYISFHDGGVGRTAYMQENGGRFYFGEVTYTESEGSFRSPIFYDSNNTAYYIDAASTSVLNTLTILGDANLELYKSQTVDMSNTTTYSTSNYYPVTISVPTEGCIIQIQNNLNSNVPSWSTHPSGFTLNLKWRTNGSGWGTTAVRRIIDQYAEVYANQTICGGITQMTNSSIEVVWLRGGGQYLFKFSRNLSATAQATTFTSNSQSVSPTSTAQNTVWSAYSGAEIKYNDQTISTTNMYTPVLYDWNNSSYYVDPASTSNLVGLTVANTITGSVSGNAATATLATKATRANGNFYIDDNYGNTVVGLYSANRYQGVFAMGDSYKLAADGTTTGTLYGIAWSHPNAGGVAANLNTHGALILENGAFLAALSGSIRSRDDMRSPIFYDSNDTAYLGDFASRRATSINGFTARTKMTLGLTAKYQEDRADHTGDTNYWVGAMGWINVDMNTLFDYGCGFIDTWNNPGNQPSGTSHWTGIQSMHYTNGTARYGWQMVGGPIQNLRFRNTWSTFTSWKTIPVLDVNDGNSGAMYAGIYYDSANTTYFIDPASTSNLVGLTVANTITGSISGNAANVTGTVAVANGGTGATSAANARTNLGATTAGSNLFTLTNPSAVTFLRVNADNTVSALNASDFRTAIGANSGETSTNQSLSGTTGCTIDVAAATVHILTLSNATTISSITYNNRSNNPAVNTLLIVLKFLGTASVTWSNVVWSNGTTPTLTGTNGKADVYALTSYKGGTTGPAWIGSVVGQNIDSTNL